MPRSRQFDPAIPERMDLPQTVSPELTEDLVNLQSINRRFGSHALIRWWLAPRWEAMRAEGRPVTILDLCTGAGDLPRLIVDETRHRSISVKITAVDFQSATLEIARKWSADYPEITYVQADITRDGAELEAAYDYVLCSLALHHFSEPDAVTILRRIDALARRGALVADLRRCLLTTVGVELLTRTLYREPMTRHDAVLSAARAFSETELRSLADQAGWKGYHHRRFRFGRQVLWMDKAPITR